MIRKPVVKVVVISTYHTSRVNNREAVDHVVVHNVYHRPRKRVGEYTTEPACGVMPLNRYTVDTVVLNPDYFRPCKRCWPRAH